MLKILKGFFVFTCLLGGIYTQAMGLEAEIEREYKAFTGKYIPNMANQPCLAVQFIYHLQESRAARAAEKIALIIGSGAGVGGISDREATPAERALMVRGINFAVREKAKFELKGGFDHVRKHQTVVAQIIQSSQRVQNLSLDNVGKNPNYNSFYPQAPVFHPYNALGHRSMFPVATKLDTSAARDLLPNDVQRKIKGLADNQVDVFFIAQQKIPGDDTKETLFRPHYWVSPDGSGWQADVRACFSQTPYGQTLTKDYETTQSVHVHDEVSSPNNFSIEEVLPKSSRSLAFWSLCLNPGDGRLAVTLHWILDGQDPQHLGSIVDGLNAKTLGALGRSISNHHSLKDLYFPF